MTATEYLRYLQKEIHTVIAATVYDKGLPITCAIDMMDSDDEGLYFLTAKGKGVYDRLKNSGYIALTGMKGENTMSCVAVSVRGKAREIGNSLLPRLFEINPYMNEIYPTAESRQALTVFQLYDGNGEWFDLSKKPIERETFTFENANEIQDGYFITEVCSGCRVCEAVCPQHCIDFIGASAVIRQENCLHCGNCLSVCPQKAVMRKG